MHKRLLKFSKVVAAVWVLHSGFIFAETPDLKERKLWVKEKVAAIDGYVKRYQTILDEISVAAEAIAPQQLDTKPYRPRFEKIDTEMATFIEHTNFDAQHRFKDNPLCQQSINSFQGSLQKLQQHKIGVLEAGWGYGASVLVQCPMSPKVYEATQKLEKIKSENSSKP